MKKLLPALSLLLISAILVTSSTYAWFSMNSTVSATGMTVKAKADKNLLISKDNGVSDPFDAEATMAINLQTMNPVSTIGGTTPKFFKINDVGANMTADSHTFGSDTTFVEAVANTNYVKDKVFIKSTGAAATNLTATVVIANGGDKALDPSLRVMLVVGSNSYIFAPVPGYSATYRGIASISTEEPVGVPTLGTADQTITADGSVILTSLSADNAVPVDIYIWYEGQDENCKATNAVTLGTTTFTITFSVAG